MYPIRMYIREFFAEIATYAPKEAIRVEVELRYSTARTGKKKAGKGYFTRPNWTEDHTNLHLHLQPFPPPALRREGTE